MDAGLDVSVNKSQHTMKMFERASDFVWAVRLGRIFKRRFSPKWEITTETHGAQLTLEKQEQDSIEECLAVEQESSGLGASIVIKDTNEVFVLQV
jgi:hypothetical protein